MPPTVLSICNYYFVCLLFFFYFIFFLQQCVSCLMLSLSCSLFSCFFFSVLCRILITRLGKRELVNVLHVLLFVYFARVNWMSFFSPSGVGCGLWLWHSLDISINFIGILIQILSFLLLKVRRILLPNLLLLWGLGTNSPDDKSWGMIVI